MCIHAHVKIRGQDQSGLKLSSFCLSLPNAKIFYRLVISMLGIKFFSCEKIKVIQTTVSWQWIELEILKRTAILSYPIHCYWNNHVRPYKAIIIKFKYYDTVLIESLFMVYSLFSVCTCVLLIPYSTIRPGSPVPFCETRSHSLVQVGLKLLAILQLELPRFRLQCEPPWPSVGVLFLSFFIGFLHLPPFYPLSYPNPFQPLNTW